MRLNDVIGKARDYARKNPDKVNRAVGKAGDALNKATKGKYRSQIDSGTRVVEQNLDTRGGRGRGERRTRDDRP